jgi:hypothetical protein
MGDKTSICWNCHAFFKYDSQDMRPNIWHECANDILTATKNPNLKEKKYRYNPPSLSPHEIELQRKKAVNNMLKELYGN